MPPSLGDAVDVGRFADHQPAVIATRLHPADVVAHDEQDVGFLTVRRLRFLVGNWRNLLVVDLGKEELFSASLHALGGSVRWSR